MLPKQLHTVNSRGGVTALRDDQTFDVGLINSAEIAAEIVRRWNAFEVMHAALLASKRAIESGIESDPQLWRDAANLTAAALAAYLPADQRQDMRGQNIDTKA